MKYHVIIVALGLALCAGSIASAASAPSTGAASSPLPPSSDGDGDSDFPVEGVITNPDWVQLPTGEEMYRFYPPIANQLAIDGVARMTCSVNSLGMLENCRVINETPAGIGFGSASLQMAAYFRMRPRTVNGAPVSGAKVTIPLHFVMYAPPAPPEDTKAAGAPPSARALILARRLEALLDSPEQARREEDQVRSVVQSAAKDGSPMGGIDPNQVEKAVESMSEAYEASIPTWREKFAVAYAATFSEAEIAGAVAFYESPAGIAWRTKAPDLDTALRNHRDARWWSIRKDARARFCQKVDCPPLPKVVATAPSE